MRERISNIAREWIKTPFFPHTAKKGVGADCVNFALAVYIEAGLLPEDTKLPPYSLDGGYHRQSSLVIGWLENCPAVMKEEKPGPGSVITFKMGRVDHHVGVMTSDHTFAHAIRWYGVIECDLRDSTWSSRLRSSWAPTLSHPKQTKEPK